jgi:hypothetical protein
MPEPAYPAARIVAADVREHFVRHIAAARDAGDGEVAPLPSAAEIEAMIDAAFWASLRHEEGYTPRISMAFVPPDMPSLPLRFANPIALASHALARLAPAVERPGIHLGVWPDGDALRVWGSMRLVPRFAFVLEVVAPGLLVLKHRRGAETSKFVNVAVLDGDQVKIIDEDGASLPDCPVLVNALLGFESPGTWVDSVNVLVQMAVSMRAHGRGGLLLVVPRDGDAWRTSIVHPIAYGVDPPFTGLADLMRHQPASPHPQWDDAVNRVVEAIAGLTAVDGATIIDAQYDLLAFGAKIMRRRGSQQVEEVTVTEPIEGSVATVSPPGQLGGTRHLSAAQFVYDQRDAVALVASQDGPFTIFAWSPCEKMVHAHRVETLLL